jgi:carbon storage regulator
LLVLSRKKDEKIVISDKITITVVRIQGDLVRLGIQAPRSMPIHREEIYDAIKAEQVDLGDVAKRARLQLEQEGGHAE